MKMERVTGALCLLFLATSALAAEQAALPSKHSDYTTVHGRK